MTQPQIIKIVNFFAGEHEFLSNFHVMSEVFEYRGVHWEHVEGAYQASKLAVVSDKELGDLSLMSPKDIKGLSRVWKDANMIDPEWHDKKYKVMEELLRLKFSIPYLREKLNELKDVHIVEANYWHDNYWGACYCPKCHNLEHQNKLGKLLMQIQLEGE